MSDLENSDLRLEESLKVNCKAVREVIELENVSGDLVGLTEKLSKLVNISGLAAANVASALLLWRKAEAAMIENLAGNELKLSTSLLANLIRAKCGRYEALHKMCERLDNKVGYSIEGMRSIISLHKSELQNAMK